ncbi:MAG: formate/nitrite transporter family protein [Limisphaerales bacterium]
MPEVFGFDCYSPKEIAERVENVGVTKANLPLLSMTALGVLAGGFIGLGALYATVVFSDATLPFAVGRLLGGLVFSLGLILVVVAGAELFTGNNLLVMAWVSRRITTGKLLENLVVVLLANFIGAAGLAWLVSLSGHAGMNGGALGKTAVAIATAKCALPFAEAFFKGVLCNLLVCLAVWLALAGRTVTDKILAIIFPISAFVAAGFEHSVANMYFIPLGLFLNGAAGAGALSWSGFIHNLIPVTLGNLVGGAVLVGLVYWVVYRRSASTAAGQTGQG